MLFRFNKILEKEEFNKLSQLDRIEFRQKYDNLEKEKPSIGTFHLIYNLLFIVGFLILVSLSFYNINQETFTVIFNLIVYVIKIFLVLIPICFIGDITISFLYNKKKKELLEEYFEQKIEVVKKK